MSLLDVAIGFDQLANTFLGGRPDETLSARAYRLRGVEGRWRHAMPLIDGLFFWQPQHCLAAWVAEMDRKQLPADYRSQR